MKKIPPSTLDETAGYQNQSLHRQRAIGEFAEPAPVEPFQALDSAAFLAA